MDEFASKLADTQLAMAALLRAQEAQLDRLQSEGEVAKMRLMYERYITLRHINATLETAHRDIDSMRRFFRGEVGA